VLTYSDDLPYGFGGFGTGDAVVEFDFEGYYANLLILQYKKPKAMATIKALSRAAIADRITESVRDAFDIDTATGHTLDILGKYVGAQRTTYGVGATKEFFEFLEYGDTPDGGIGFAEYGDDPVSGLFLFYGAATRTAYALSDDEFRRVIQFLAKANAMFLSMEGIDDLLHDTFEDKVFLIDNEDMTITYHHDSTDTDTLFSILEDAGFLPKPMGVSMSVVED